MNETRRPTLIVSVRRALRLMEAVASHPGGAPAKQLARQADLPLATAYHLLRTLVHDGYVVRTADGLYSQGRPIPGVGGGGHHSAVLLQAAARMRFGPVEIYNSAVKGYLGEVLRRAGGRDPVYVRSELIARF